MQLNRTNNDGYRQALGKLFLMCLLVFGTSAVSAQESVRLWDSANHFYEQKEYDSAVSLYLRIAAESVPTASLYYNLGNAYYRLDRTALSILYFEKALRLNPRDKNIADNLALAQSRIHNPLTTVAPIFFITWWTNFLQFLPSSFWAVFTFLLFLFLLGFIYIWEAGARVPHAGRWLSLLIVLLLGSALIFYARERAANQDNKAVVMEEDAPLYHDANALGVSITIPAGTTVLINDEKAGYYGIQLPNGANGWVSRNLVVKVAGQ